MSISSLYLRSPRWAAKEAVIKAFSPKRRLYLRDIVVVGQRGSTPIAIVVDPNHSGHRKSKADIQTLLADKLFPQFEALSPGHIPSELIDNIPGELCRISISHDGDYATATALADLTIPGPINEPGEIKQSEEAPVNADQAAGLEGSNTGSEDPTPARGVARMVYQKHGYTGWGDPMDARRAPRAVRQKHANTNSDDPTPARRASRAAHQRKANTGSKNATPARRVQKKAYAGSEDPTPTRRVQAVSQKKADTSSEDPTRARRVGSLYQKNT